MPQLGGIMTLFSRVKTAASLWLHLQAGNLFAAKTVYLEGVWQQLVQQLQGKGTGSLVVLPLQGKGYRFFGLVPVVGSALIFKNHPSP